MPDNKWQQQTDTDSEKGGTIWKLYWKTFHTESEKLEVMIEVVVLLNFVRDFLMGHKLEGKLMYNMT